jgi:hypothetical protein
MPFPLMPFQTHVNIVFENGVGEPTKKMTRSETGGTKQEIDADTPVENLKIANQKYAYNLDPDKLSMPDGQIVDFVVA